MHTRKARDAARTCDVVFANSAFTAADVVETLGVAGGRIVVAQPGLGPGLSAGRRARRPRRSRPSSAWGRSSRARTSRASSRPGALLDGELGLALAGGEGWGDRPDLADPRIRRLGFVPDERARRASTAALPCSSTRRCSRASACP